MRGNQVMPDIFMSAGKALLATLAKEPGLSAAALAEIHEGEIDFISTVVTTLTAHGQRLEEIRQMAQRLSEDRPTLTVLGNLGFEAAREALPERKAMLAAAVGGILRPQFDTQLRARIERKLRELDPEDVRHLYGISLVPRPQMTDPPSQPGATVDHHAMARHDYAGTQPQQLEILVSSGCIERHRLANYSGMGLSLTSIGNNVLLTVEDYVVDCGPVSPLPPPRTVRQQPVAAE